MHRITGSSSDEDSKRDADKLTRPSDQQGDVLDGVEVTPHELDSPSGRAERRAQETSGHVGLPGASSGSGSGGVEATPVADMSDVERSVGAALEADRPSGDSSLTVVQPKEKRARLNQPAPSSFVPSRPLPKNAMSVLSKVTLTQSGIRPYQVIGDVSFSSICASFLKVDPGLPEGVDRLCNGVAIDRPSEGKSLEEEIYQAAD